MISTYKAIRWFRASRSRKLGHVLVARDRLVLGAETDWVTRGYKFRILEFCLGDPVPPALRSVPHNGRYLLSAQLVLTYRNVCPYKNRFDLFDRTLRHSCIAAFTMEQKEFRKGRYNENRVHDRYFRLDFRIESFFTQRAYYIIRKQRIRKENNNLDIEIILSISILFLKIWNRFGLSLRADSN